MKWCTDFEKKYSVFLEGKNASILKFLEDWPLTKKRASKICFMDFVKSNFQNFSKQFKSN